MLAKREADPQLLQMALYGYEQQEREIREKMAELRAALGQRDGRPATARRPQAEEPHHTLSKKARKRIAAAQKKRWANYRAARAAAAAQ